MSDEHIGYGTSYSYKPFVRSKDMVFVAGQIPKVGPDTVLRPGSCGTDNDLNSAREGAKLAARQAIHWIEAAMTGSEMLDQVLRVSVFVAVSKGFTQISEVADAASETFIEHFGKRGEHPRSVLGLCLLPRNAPVLIEVTARLRNLAE